MTKLKNTTETPMTADPLLANVDVSCENCIYYSSGKMCKTCDEDWSEFVKSENAISYDWEGSDWDSR